MATQFRSVLKDLVVMFFALAGLGGAVGLYVFLPAVPSVMVATFLGIGIAALVYGFLGGIYTDASFGYGVFKVGGSLAALLGTVYFLDDRLSTQLEKLRAETVKGAERSAAIAANHLSGSMLEGRWTWQSAADNWFGTMDVVQKDGALTFDGQMSKVRDGVSSLVFEMDDGTATLHPDDRFTLGFTAREPGGRTYRLETVKPLQRQLSFAGSLRVPKNDPHYATMMQNTWGFGMQQDR